MEIKTQTRKGLFNNIKVTFLDKESFFINDFIASENECELELSGPPIEDILQIPIIEQEWFIIQSGTYIASTRLVDLDTKWQGFSKNIFDTKLFMSKSTGNGAVFVNG